MPVDHSPPPVSCHVCSVDPRYGAHLPGAGEGSDEEEDDGSGAGIDAILAESGNAGSGKAADRALSSRRGARDKRPPRTDVTKVYTFFGIPKIDGVGLAGFVARCCTVEDLDLASVPGIGDAAIVSLVTAVKRMWGAAQAFQFAIKKKSPVGRVGGWCGRCRWTRLALRSGCVRSQ